jgi:hypothetical protein
MMSGEDANGVATVLRFSQVGNARYFSAAGFSGRAVCMADRRAHQR